MDIKQLLVMAAVVEAVVTLLMSVYTPDTSKPFLERINLKLILSIGVGLLLAFGFNADMLIALGLPTAVPPIGLVLTGLLLGRGSNFVHDIVKLAQVTKENQQANLLLKK